MRIFVCLAFLAFAACGNEDSVSLTSDGGTGGGGLDGSMNNRDMAVPPPDMATPRDMAVAPDMAIADMSVAIDMDSPDMNAWPTIAVGTAIPLGLARASDIRDAKIVAIGESIKRIESTEVPGIAFVRDGSDGLPHVYFTTARLVDVGTEQAYAWSEPEEVSVDDVLVDDTTTDGPRTRAMDLAFDPESQRIAIAYVAEGSSETDSKIIVRTRLVTETVWERVDVTETERSAEFAVAPVIAVHGGKVVVAYVQESTNCLADSSGSSIDTEPCRRVVFAKFDPAEVGLPPVLRALPMLAEFHGSTQNYTPYQAAKVHPSIAFDDRGAVAIAAFFEMDRHDGTGVAGKISMWREPWNGWEYTGAYGQNMLATDSLPALSLGFFRGVFSVAFRGAPDLQDWSGWEEGNPEPTPTSTPGVFVMSRGRLDAFGAGSWSLKSPLAIDDSDIDAFGRSLELLIDGFGQKSLVVERAHATDDDAIGAGPVLLSRRTGGPFSVEPVLARTTIIASGFSKNDFDARALDATLFTNGLLATIFVAPESSAEGAPDGLWAKLTAPKEPPVPCRFDVDEHARIVETSDDTDIVFSEVVLDDAEEPIVVYAERRTTVEYAEELTFFAVHFTRFDPQDEWCAWSEPVELTRYTTPSSDIALRPDLVSVIYDAAANHMVLSFPVSYSYDDAKTYMRFVSAGFDSAYGPEEIDMPLVDTMEVAELGAASLALAGRTLFVTGARRFRDCFGADSSCVKPVVFSFSADSFELLEQEVVDIARAEMDFSIPYGAYPQLQITDDGTQYLAWAQDFYRYDPDTDLTAYDLEVVLAKKASGEADFVVVATLPFSGTDVPNLEGGSLRFAHAALGGGDHVLLTNLVPDVLEPGYAMYAYVDDASSPAFYNLVDLPTSSSFELVRDDMNAISIVGSYDIERLSDGAYNGVGPYVAAIDEMTEPPSLAIFRHAPDVVASPPVTGEARGVALGREAGLLVTYATQGSYDEGASVVIPRGLYVWRQR